MDNTQSLYDDDFYSWTQQQARLLQAGRFTQLDLNNLIEEIETMGRSEYRRLESHLSVLLMHLLKYQLQAKFDQDSQYETDKWRRSWLITINAQRFLVSKHLRKNPGLKSRLREAYNEAFESARYAASNEMKQELACFPNTCPWSYNDIMQDDFLPEG